MPTYSIGYDFNPNDNVWVLNGQSIETGVVLQVSALVTLTDVNVITNTINYLILLNCNNGTVSVTGDKLFSTFADASTALETYISSLTC